MSVTDLPPHLYGKPRRHDLGLGLVMSAAGVLARVTSRVPVRRRLAAAGDGTLVLSVASRRDACADGSAADLLLVAPGGGALPAWWPGAHLDVFLPSGRMRTYSLCGDHRDRSRYRIAIRRVDGGGGGSVEAHEVLVPGASVTIRGPRNAFPFAPPGAGSPARRVHFVAGGIGITPILPMLRLAAARGIDAGLVYCGRDLDSLPFLAELAEFGDRVTVRTDVEHGLPSAADLLPGLRPGDAVYCCGPAPIIEMVRDAVRGLPGTELHIERFAPPPVIDGVAFTVELARSGDLVEVPADRTALDVVRDGRPQVAYSCRQGFCGTCVVTVLHGEVSHRDTILTDEQRAAGQMLLCVSRGEGHLTLDL